MKIDDDIKRWILLFVWLLVPMIFAALAFYGNITCTKCGERKSKSSMLILHGVLDEKTELAIPYCPRCYVEIVNSPSLTWAGAGKDDE